MILFENSIIKLDYTPATDILDVKYPDLHLYILPEIKHSIDILVDTVKNYDVKKVLIDSTDTVMSVTAEESREIATHMAFSLASTRLQKLARLQSLDNTVETRAKSTIQYFNKSQMLPFELQNFSDRTVALAWLQS
ncbi:hypothetical protein [Pontibacter ruber]|uniref:STAS/SEC14 domain-containing protein n=1 Tax=Pontibacter ruber TaxID=1343895 RepID=A0ABW5D1W8_9BACT|nr:hypothetical protein [Pontibacter ruber]